MTLRITEMSNSIESIRARHKLQRGEMEQGRFAWDELRANKCWHDITDLLAMADNLFAHLATQRTMHAKMLRDEAMEISRGVCGKLSCVCVSLTIEADRLRRLADKIEGGG